MYTKWCVDDAADVAVNVAAAGDAIMQNDADKSDANLQMQTMWML